MRRYSTLPSLPDAGPLERYRDTLALVVPQARTNLVTNPSFELATTGWSAASGSIARTTTDQYHGAYSLALTPTTSLVDGVFFSTVTLTSGITYAASIKVKGVAGVPYLFALATTGNAILAQKSFRGTGRWQWIWVFYTETSTTTRRVLLRKEGSANTGVVYLDGAQVEACGSEGVFVTTYIDGDQRGLVPNQYPPAYLWTGTPHASTSTRSAQTRAGGRVMRFSDFGFLLSAIIGFGLAPPQHEALSFAQLDGGQYQNTIKPPRSFSFAGRWDAFTPSMLDIGRTQLAARLDRDAVGQRQPLTLALQARACGVDCGEPITVQALYSGGLEGNAQELPSQAGRVDFTQYLPTVMGRDGGAALTVQSALASLPRLALRSPGGVWSAPGTGISGGSGLVQAIARGLDGTIYVGGNFTDAGGSGADNLAAYNPTTGTWSVVGSATAINGQVQALAVGPDGRLYAGGIFTNAGGDANADGIAVWNGSAWAALGTGISGGGATVNALVFAPGGTLYAGGTFTDAGGSGADNIAAWNGSAWSVLGSATALNAAVNSLAWGGNQLYVGGGFSNAGGIADADRIAAWNGSAWSALGTGSDGDVVSMAVGANGLLYAGTNGTTLGTVVNAIAMWNGTMWAPLGSGLGNTAQELVARADGSLLALGVFTTAGGVTVPAGSALWNGAAWVPFDITPPTLGIATAIETPDGTLVFGFNASGAGTAAGVTSVTNNGTAQTFPTLTIKGPSSGTARIYQLVNTTTGVAIYLNLTLNAGETAVLTLDPTNITFVSDFQGNILRTILPGSQTTAFVLQPGANSISFFAASSTVTAVLAWQTAYLSLEDALYQVAP